jgi:soluble lytic murein transglycosylase-like protein
MRLGQILSETGYGMGLAQSIAEKARTERQNQLAIEEQNRVADLKKQVAGLEMSSFQPVDVPQFTQPFMPGQAMPMGEAPAAPPGLRPGQQPLPAGMQPSQAGAGRGMINPPMAGQPQPTYPGAPAAPAAPTTPLTQAERDRLALLRVPTAALDVVQAPAAAGLNLFGSAVAGVQNIAGRVVNAITGEQTLPTDTEYRKYSLTPFYDEYVRKPLDAATPAPAQSEKKAEAPKAAPAGQPTKAAQQYDNKVTPYDAIITQSAQQYGIDPVVFKRLLGTESSFNPNALGTPLPSGQRAIGIAQILPQTHNISPDQARDPNFAIPFAAQLFSQYLRQSGGDYNEALMRYKGASSEKGRAAMQGPINTILSGIAPSTQAAPGAPGAAPAPLEVPQTQARNMEMAEFYLANPESIPYEAQQINQMAQQQAELLTRQRNEAAQLAQVYMRSGTQQGIDAAMRLRDNIGQLDASLLQLQQQVVQKQTYLQGMQGLRELATANDPRRLAGVLTQYMGAPVGIQPRPDGNYNYFVNGQKVQDGISPAQLAAMAMREFSPEARQAAASSAALENELALKRKYGDAMVNAMRDIQKSIIDGEYKIAEERAKQVQGKLTIDTSKGVAYFQRGNNVFVINPDGTVEEVGGVKIETGPSARPVAGLNLGR